MQIRPGNLVHSALEAPGSPRNISVSVQICMQEGREALQRALNKLTELPEEKSFSLASPFAGQGRGKVSENEHIFQFFPLYEGNASDATESHATWRLEWEFKAERWEKINFLTTKSSWHTSSYLNRAPETNSNSEETNATIIEISPGKSYCSGCLKLGQTEQWQKHNRKWMT